MPAIRKPVTSNKETKIRSPIFDRRDRLAFHKNPRFYMQWVNDVKNDVNDYLDAGFTFVSEDERWGKESDIDVGKSLDSRASVNVGRAGGLENVTAFLMKIPKEEWAEITAPYKKEAQNALKQMTRQKQALNEQEGEDGFYGGLSIK